MDRHQAQRGGSRIGMVIALVVVGYGLLILSKWGPARVDHYELGQAVTEILKFKNTQRPIPKEEDIRLQIFDKAKEIGIAEFISMENIRVWVEGERIHAQVKYTRPFKVPGIEKTLEYQIDTDWAD